MKTETFQIAEYNQTAAALAELQSRYGRPFDVETAKGMEEARKARTEVRGYRVALENVRKAIKAPALERARLIDDEAKRITAALLAIEEPIDAAIKAEETRKEEEKAAKARAEAARIAALAARVHGIRERVVAVANQDAAAIREALAQAQAFEPDPDEFAEQWPEAMKAIAETRQTLETLWAERDALEKRQAEEEARLQAEREELARQKAEEDARLQAQREELARQQAELARQRAEENAQRQAEREELDRLRAAEDARQQAEREAQARAEEEARQQAEREEQARRQAEEDARLQAERTAKTARIKKPARIDPLAAIKDALAAGTLNGAEAIDRAYQLGFEAGENVARKAA